MSDVPSLDSASGEGVQRIVHGSRVLAVVLRGWYEPASLEFLTPDKSALQLGVMNRHGGYSIAPHVHRTAARTIRETYEVLFLTRGRLEIDFYAPEEPHGVVSTVQMGPGDVVLLMSGGHGFRMLEDCRIVEVKQGPYLGAADDKFRIAP